MQFGGSEQHDSQEFLSFLLDGLHEDLNRILNKPTYEVTQAREEELEKLPQQIASEQEWKVYRMRNDSLVVDFFQGQFRNRLECMTCRKASRVQIPPSAVQLTKVSCGHRRRRHTTALCICPCRYHRPRTVRLTYNNVSMHLSRPKSWKRQMHGMSFF